MACQTSLYRVCFHIAHFVAQHAYSYDGEHLPTDQHSLRERMEAAGIVKHGFVKACLNEGHVLYIVVHCSKVTGPLVTDAFLVPVTSDAQLWPVKLLNVNALHFAEL